MIVVRLCGGLGNQLFQYAAGRSLAFTRKTELVLDLSWYRETPEANTPRQYELSNYPIQARVANSKEKRILRIYSNRIFKNVPILHWPWRRFNEKGFEFNINFPDIQDGTYIDGYWQSYKYFEYIEDIIRAELLPLTPPADMDKVIGEKIHATNSISVHVRRGDYVTQKVAAAVHGVCPLKYYDTALNEIKNKVLDPHFYVFSDDPEWAKSNLIFPGPAVFVDHNDSTTAFQDLWLMSQCRHHIIANSSFSWWAAWLNPQEDSFVIAPKRWFMDDRSTTSLTPINWTRI